MYTTFADLEQQITQLGTRTVLIAAVLLTVLVLVAAATKNKKKYTKWKKPLFLSMSGILVLSTLTLFGTTIYLNTTSDSGGPVHWHADIEIWACGNELALANPTGFLSNKIGTATYHEHNDKRIHLEGVVVDQSYDASLGKFMDVTGGHIDENRLLMAVTPDTFEIVHTDGDGSPNPNANFVTQYLTTVTDEKGKTYNAFDTQIGDGTCNGNPAEVQVFVYTYDKKANTYSQKRIERPQDYTLRDEPQVPPGDCVIVEFDVSKERTDKLCKQYGVKDKLRCEAFGVPADRKEKVCKIEEVYLDADGGNL